MGSGSSKDVAASSSGGLPKPRSRRVRVFKSSCFGLLSVLPDGHQKVDADRRQRGFSCVDKDENKKVGDSNHRSEKVGLPHHDNLAYSHSDGEQFGEDNETTSQIDLGTGSNFGTDAITERSSNTSGRSHSRFSFIPDGISFRLNRAVSLGSTGSRSIFSTGLSVPFSTGLSVPSDRRENNLINHENVDRNCIQNDSTLEAISSQDETRINAGTEATISQYSSRSFVETRNTRHTHRRIGSQEPLEGTVRFSRTLSVGRLRDRVLRRAPFSEGLFDPAFPEDRSVWSNGHANGRRAFGGARRAPSSSRRASELLPDSSGTIPYRAARSIDINADIASGAPHHRVGNHDVFEHRSVFLERRRRIRSQVRALQRLGSRFESLSGHDRSCILSGQHRTGRCTCRTNSQTANPDEDTSARASISRIVMLAEALFEVLDEIHQQSVVLSSRPSFSSIGSVPAPKEVVECIPTKIYGKPSKNQNEETSQCYICLVEYEEGDCLRMLPCNHEFHQTCIDKWLKEIHRVCPLCRGDVCISDASNKQLS